MNAVRGKQLLFLANQFFRLFSSYLTPLSWACDSADLQWAFYLQGKAQNQHESRALFAIYKILMYFLYRSFLLSPLFHYPSVGVAYSKSSKTVYRRKDMVLHYYCYLCILCMYVFMLIPFVEMVCRGSKKVESLLWSLSYRKASQRHWGLWAIPQPLFLPFCFVNSVWNFVMDFFV